MRPINDAIEKANGNVASPNKRLICFKIKNHNRMKKRLNINIEEARDGSSNNKVMNSEGMDIKLKIITSKNPIERPKTSPITIIV